MNFYPCSQQQEIAAALREGRWPGACTPELRMHVEACPSCHELVLVTQTLQRARRDALPMAQLVPPGLLWWKAQLRRQNAIAERIAKPISLIEKSALALAIILAAAWAVVQRNEVADWLHRLVNLPFYGVFRADATLFAGDSTTWTLLLAVAAMFGVLGGLLVYIVASSE